MKNICKFCGKEKKLINAHIIPKNFYIGLVDGKYIGINTKTGKYKYWQNGNYDSNILCGECDNNILGEFDKESYRILLGDFSKYEKICIAPNYTIYKITNDKFNYTKLRKFFVSVLWRASVATSEEWKCINLGPYEKKALEILKDIKEHDSLFKILIYKNKINSNFNQQISLGKIKYDKYKAYIIQMAGYYIKIIVDSRRLTSQFRRTYERCFLNPESVQIIETPNVDKWNYAEFQGQMQKLDKIGFVPPKPKSQKSQNNHTSEKYSKINGK